MHSRNSVGSNKLAQFTMLLKKATCETETSPTSADSSALLEEITKAASATLQDVSCREQCDTIVWFHYCGTIDVINYRSSFEQARPDDSR
jgi:hypothetical protein